MFTITRTRSVGLIAAVCTVVCAAVVAPQAHSRIAPPDVEPRQEQPNTPAAAAPHKSVTAAIFVYTPTNPGWGAAATAAKTVAAKPTPEPVKTAPVLVCLGQVEHTYVYPVCELWS